MREAAPAPRSRRLRQAVYDQTADSFAQDAAFRETTARGIAALSVALEKEFGCPQVRLIQQTKCRSQAANEAFTLKLEERRSFLLRLCNFSSPQDVEGVISPRGTLFVVQSRPQA